MTNHSARTKLRDKIRLVNAFYKNVKSCEVNNGLCSYYFNVERGVRERNPFSPYRFVNPVEILAIAVRNDEIIKGSKISDCCEATRIRSRLISVAYVTSLGSLRQKPSSFEIFWMYVYHRICLDLK